MPDSLGHTVKLDLEVIHKACARAAVCSLQGKKFRVTLILNTTSAQVPAALTDR